MCIRDSGEGYEGFTSLMHGQAEKLFDNSLFYRFSDIDWVVIIFVIATMFFKVIAMASTNAAGGVGGTFAPSLFVGAFTGASIAPVSYTHLCTPVSGSRLKRLSTVSLRYCSAASFFRKTCA